MEQTEYLNDPVLQLWAVYGTCLSKSEIISVTRMLGIKIKNASNYLKPLEDADVISCQRMEGSVAYYGIKPRAWVDILRNMDTKTYQRMKIYACIRVRYSSDRNLAFSEAVNAYFNQQPFEQVLEALMPESKLRFGQTFSDELMIDLRYEESLLPVLKRIAAKRPAELAEAYCQDLNHERYADRHFDIMQEIISDNPDVPADRRLDMKTYIGIHHWLIRKGDIKEAMHMAKGSDRVLQCLEAILYLQQGDYDKAFKLFAAALRGTGKKLFLHDIFNFYYAIALAYSQLDAARTKMEALLKSEELRYARQPAIEVILKVTSGRKKEVSPSQAFGNASHPISSALTLLAMEHYKFDTSTLRPQWVKRVLDGASTLLRMELSDVLPELAGEREELRSRTGMHPTLPPYTERPEWEIMLDELLGIYIKGKAQDKASAGKGSQTRIIYKVNRKYGSITPVVQKSKDGINWTAGRNVSLENFSKGKTEGMLPEDKAVAACVTCYSYGWYGSVAYELSGSRALSSLAGHPLVFDEETGRHLDVVMDKPQLTVSLEGNMYRIHSDIDTNEIENGYSIAHPDGQSIKVVRVDGNMKRTLETLSQTFIPKKATEKLTRLLEALSGTMVVMSDLLKDSESIATRKSHPETVVQLQPMGDAIRCSLLVRPFGKVPPVCKPGKGMQVLSTAIEGKQVQTRRNLKKEKENYEAVTALMVDFEEESTGENTWMLTPVECLELLDKLRDMGDCCVTEWPEGERFRVSYAPLQPSAFHLSIQSAASWFELEGEVTISDKARMKVADLMDRLAEAKGNFIQIGDEEYVRISHELRRHIEMVDRMASRHRNAMRISTFNAQQLEGLVESGMDVTTDQTFTTLVNRIREAQETDIRIPRNIQADLRSYQKEGYAWMSRLAMWGAGALLADDMGLGKTVQTLTLLLSRAKEGPQLVIVPTSLILNWKEEAARFAPELNVRLLNRAGEDRQRMVREAGAFDVVVSTYGLLITEEETLCSRTWHTIVLDEAHTIKNKETKMSRVAMTLKADFRLLLTGTPLQNHVSELWNLMQFANPHLLGTYQEFTERFLLPIERNHDKERQRLLKRLITPFILRRTKNDVLNELPEKTEITLKVDLSEEEWAFYDNLRQRALASLEDEGASAMQALAEITRLRQAACNVRLVEKSLDISSSKLSSFMELTDNLHANHHRALVFSQFTSHLALVREELDRRGIAYLYLDGATPARERTRLVEAFQQGDMPLFLISLKAGGLGLNLTAADYVVHLDPWWNPAIEEQASDRACRIGQQKPVTVYRLIAANTIEEKIIALHQTKKNMADALLEGGDVSASMSREEMIELLREL